MNDKNDIATKIAAVGWALFLVWLGASFLMKLSPGVGLVGVGVIILGSQLARKYFQLGLEMFWVVVGGLFLASGFSDFYGVPLPWDYVFPGLLILVGLGILFSIIKGKRG